MGEVIEAQGDYNDAARQYELAYQTIENGIKQGVLAEFQQGKDALEATLPASRAVLLNSWGLALKRCGFLLLHMLRLLFLVGITFNLGTSNSFFLFSRLDTGGKFQHAIQIYQQALSLAPQDTLIKNNLQNCRNAVSNFKVNGQLSVSGLNLKKTYKGGAKFMSNCSLPSCKEVGEKTSFKTCGRCRLAMYCSKEHQREDWPRHKKECKAKAKVVKQ